MIPIEKLKQVRTIITHANCPDGIASAILLHDALPNAQIRFLTHGTKEYRELPAEDGMLFCDITPPAERAHEFLPHVPVVLDHHKSEERLVKGFTHYVFADEKTNPSVSGAVLAYQEVWLPLRGNLVPYEKVLTYRDVWLPLQGNLVLYETAKQFALLAGVRDTWQSSSPDFQRSNEQAAALTFWPIEKWLAQKKPFDDVQNDFHRMLDLGSVLFAKKLEAAKKALLQSWRTTVNDVRCVIFQDTTLTSDVAEIVGEGADLIIGFGFVVEDGRFLLNVSTRSHTSFDCAAFAKRYDGGGHTKAAGFTIPFGPGSPNPYSLLRLLCETHLNPHSEK